LVTIKPVFPEVEDHEKKEEGLWSSQPVMLSFRSSYELKFLPFQEIRGRTAAPKSYQSSGNLLQARVMKDERKFLLLPQFGLAYLLIHHFK
jgi:hypothetical protein